MTIIGWDVGGVNTKAAAIVGGEITAVINRPYELQRAPERLATLLRELAFGFGEPAAATHAVTMTAELSQMFRLKRDGVGFVLDAFETAFPGSPVYVYGTDHRFRTLAQARQEPLPAAAANWAAAAAIVAAHYPDAILVDTGTTTTDVIPIVGGRVAAVGRTDTDRLASGELVYSGALRTPVEAVTAEVTVGDRRIAVSAEGFALIGDVHLYRGDLAATDYSVAAPDGRPTTPEFAGERLARVVCADREQLDERALLQIAESIAAAQVERLAAAIGRVRSRHPALTIAVVTGVGDFVAAAASRAAALDVVPLAQHLGVDAARSAPASAVALLLEKALSATAVR